VRRLKDKPPYQNNKRKETNNETEQDVDNTGDDENRPVQTNPVTTGK
jgi:hypothetical protein